MTQANPEEMELHCQIQSGDDIALAKLYDLYSECIISCVKKWFPRPTMMDEALVLEAVNEAFWGYYRNPATFDPNKKSLLRFLEIAAERDMKNILQRKKKYSNKQSLPEDVELEENFWNNIKKDTQSPDEEIIRQETMDLVDKELANYFSVDKDIALAKMIMQGVRETDEFAEVLQIKELEKEERQREVKKHKDRITKVIERNQVKLKLKNLLQ